MKQTTIKRLFALALAGGILMTGALGSVAAGVSPIQFDAAGITESKAEAVAGEAQPQTIHYVKPGAAVTVSQNKEFTQTIVNVRVWEVDNPDNLYVFYNREVWPTEKAVALDPVTVKFESLKDASGASFDLAKPGKLYQLAVDVLDLSDPKSPDGALYGGYARAYFRVMGGNAAAPTTPPATAPIDPATLPPHGDPIYRPGPHDGPEVGPFGNITGYLYVPGYGYVLDEGGGAICTGGNPNDADNPGESIGTMG